MRTMIASLLMSGLAFGAGPCLASCGPLLLGYVIGSGKSVPVSMQAWCMFSLARLLVYGILGILVGCIGEFALGRFYESGFVRLLNIAAGIFIVVLGATILVGRGGGHPVCRGLHTRFVQRHAQSAFSLGIIAGLMPCAPMLAVFGFIAFASRHLWQAAVYAVSFGLGTVLSPLCIMVFFAGFLSRLLREKPSLIVVFQRLCAAVLVFFGIRMIVMQL
jgi:uncharacterized protein